MCRISPPENAENWCDEFTPPYITSSPEIVVLYSIIDVVPSNGKKVEIRVNEGL